MLKRKLAGSKPSSPLAPRKKLNSSDKPVERTHTWKFLSVCCLITCGIFIILNPLSISYFDWVSRIDPSQDIHVVISSGCSVQQFWQSESLMWSWKKVNHPGKITRIVSGCENFEAEKLFSQTSVEEANFFFTEDFTKMIDGKPCWFFNKPNGMQKFIKESGVRESVIVLLDPDMTIVKPFDNHLPSSEYHVTEGHPLMSRYALNSVIFGWDFCHGGDCGMSRGDASKYYMGGPPYILHRRDWDRMVDDWVALSEKAFAKGSGGGSSSTFVHTNAEMYGFILSCAQLGLRFSVDNAMMASNTAMHATQELWDLEKVRVMHYAHQYGKDIHSSEKFMRWSKHNHPHDLLINCRDFQMFDEHMYMEQFELAPKHKFALENSLVVINKAVRDWRRIFGCEQREFFCPYNDACHGSDF